MSFAHFLLYYALLLLIWTLDEIYFRFKPTKVAGGLSSLKAKRHRHKDVTLAMLAPDIIESDPYVSKILSL